MTEGICGWRQILRPAYFIDVAQEAIETGLSSILPPALRGVLSRAPEPCRDLGLPGASRNLHTSGRQKPPGGLQGPQGLTGSRADLLQRLKGPPLNVHSPHRLLGCIG